MAGNKVIKAGSSCTRFFFGKEKGQQFIAASL